MRHVVDDHLKFDPQNDLQNPLSQPTPNASLHGLAPFFFATRLAYANHSLRYHRYSYAGTMHKIGIRYKYHDFE